MIESLQALFLTDDRARWHAILWSWLAATVAGAVFAATNMNDQNLALIGLMASFSVFIYRFIVYHGARVKSISSLRRTASTAQIEEAITTDLRVRRRVFTELPLGAAAAALSGLWNKLNVQSAGRCMLLRLPRNSIMRLKMGTRAQRKGFRPLGIESRNCWTILA